MLKELMTFEHLDELGVPKDKQREFYDSLVHEGEAIYEDGNYYLVNPDKKMWEKATQEAKLNRN